MRGRKCLSHKPEAASDSHLEDVLEGTVDGRPDGLALVVGNDLVTNAGEVLTVQAKLLVDL